MKVVKRRRLKPWVRRSLLIMKRGISSVLVIIGLFSIWNWIFSKPVETCSYESNLQEVEEKSEKQIVLVNDPVNDEEIKVEETFKEVEQDPIKLEYRMTYYYPGDSDGSGSVTASGKSSKDFKLNENGWYTYNGKLVVATASNRLLNWKSYKNSKEPTYNLYDELILNINGQDYEAIVMDVCGACMKDRKIDLFVKDRSSGLDTKINVRKAK